jgi:hypothetical protein
MQAKDAYNDHKVVAVARVFVSVFVLGVFRVFSVPVPVFSVSFVETTTFEINIRCIQHITIIKLRLLVSLSMSEGLISLKLGSMYNLCLSRVLLSQRKRH